MLARLLKDTAGKPFERFCLTLFFMKPLILLGGEARENLAEAVRARTHPVVEYLSFAQKFAVPVLHFGNYKRSPLTKRMSPYWRSVLSLNRDEYSHVLAMGEDVGLPAAAVRALRGERYSLSIIFHGSYLNSPRFAYAAAFLKTQRNVRLLCLSESLCRYLREKFGFSEEQAVGVGYGVDTDFFHPGEAAPQKNLVLSAGTATRDYKTLVSAAADLPVECCIAADSAWFRKGLDIEAAGEKLPPNVTVASCKDYVGLRKAYAQAAVVVVPLYNAKHACGYAVIAEAMSMGKPVITTRTESPSDYVVEGETGFYVAPQDKNALREKIRLLLSNPSLAASMGQKARQRMQSFYRTEQYVERLAQHSGIGEG